MGTTYYTMIIRKTLFISFLAVTCHVAGQQPIYKQADAPTEQRVEDLLGRMTLEEKVGQLLSPLGWKMYEKEGSTTRISPLFKEMMSGNMPIGTFYAVLRADPWTQKTPTNGLNPKLSAETLNQLQRYAVEETRLGIPLFFAEECPHGHMAIGATVFPTGLLMASTWDKDLIYQVGEATALEARSQGANLGYGPILDIAREPRWSRMEETFGEDPVLTGILGVSYMQGMQGKSPSDGKHLYSTLKHFAAYGVPVGGHNGSQVSLGMHQLFTDYLSPFERAVKAGASSIMTSYNSIDGVPCTSNKYLLTDILRNRWGFNGFVLSDLFSIDGISEASHIAADVKDAGKLALEAGVDMDLGANAYGKRTLELIKENRLDTKYVDRAVSNILRLKFKMGLFENPYVSPKKAQEIVHCTYHRELARKVAREGIVLLKNDGVLPLSKQIKSLAVIGPNADNMYNQLGDYTAPQPDGKIITPLEGIRKAVSRSTRIRYVKGCAIRDVSSSNLEEAVRASKESDAVVLVVGGSSARDFKTEYVSTGAATVSSAKDNVVSDMDCGEGFDRSTLDLLGDQERLIQSIAETGKPLIIVYIQGRTLNMNLASEKANALLTAWYPGEEGGTALAEILFGDYNPSGRLPVSIPRSEGQLPVYYSLGNQRNYLEGSGNALYGFGFGLSYSKFAYKDLEILPGDEKDIVKVINCTVTNQGTMDGSEVVQLYLRDEMASVAQPPIALKAFQRRDIPKGESRKITFKLRKEDVALYNGALQKVVEPGDFTVMIGAASNDIRLQGKFTILPQ